MLFMQAERQVQLSTPLGEDVLYLDKFLGREEISRLFRFDAGMFSEDREIVFDDIVGHPISISVSRPGAGPRFFHGYVSQFEHVLDLENVAYYRAVVVPWLWFLTRTSNCRIFQGMTVPDIVREVVRHHGFSDVEMRLSETYPELEYCTQYRETDFNFVSRLLEEFGIHYSFRHESDRHVLCLADSMNAYEPVTGLEEIPFRPATDHNRTDNSIWEWTVGRRVQPFRYEIRDFDYSAPRTTLVSTETAMPKSHGHSGYEIYDYAGLRSTPDHGNHVAGLRIEELESQHERAHGMTGSAGLGVGSIFNLIDAPRGDQNREYLVTGGEHEIRTNRFRSGDEDSELEETYSYRFSCLPADAPFRPARVTPRPVVQGPQTAIVTGPDDEEIYVDDKARVKVRFHWDRANTPNEDSSIWIRVAQPWAGNRWGAMFLPRVGHEVVIEFLEGDPDRPLITGSVSNGANLPVWLNKLNEAPISKTVSGFCSQSTKDSEGANMVVFVDQAGEEQLYLRAQRDYELEVLNDRRERIGKDRNLVVKGNQKDLIEKNRHEVVKKSHTESIGGDRHLGVGGKEAKKVDASQSLTVGADRLVSITGSHTDDTGGSFALTAGADATIKANSKVKLECGGSSIEIGPGSVKITSPKLEFTGAQFDCNAGMTKITSSMVDLTAAVVKAAGVVQGVTFIASAAVVSPSYTPGAGNIL